MDERFGPQIGIIQVRKMLIFHLRPLHFRGMTTLLIRLISHVLHEVLLKFVARYKVSTVSYFLLRGHLVRARRVHTPPIRRLFSVIRNFLKPHLSSGLLAPYSLDVPEINFKQLERHHDLSRLWQ